MDYSYSVWQVVHKKWKEKQLSDAVAGEKLFRQELFFVALKELQKETLSAHFSPSSPFFYKLLPREFMLLILRDRFLLPKEEIEAILSCTAGSLGLQLMHVREKFFRVLFSKQALSAPLTERIKCNQVLDECAVIPFSKKQGSFDGCSSSPYYSCLQKARTHCQWLKVHPLKKEEFHQLFVLSSKEKNLKLRKKSYKEIYPRGYRLLWEGLSLSILVSFIVIFLAIRSKPNITKESGGFTSLSTKNLKQESPNATFNVSFKEKDRELVPEEFPLGPSYHKGTADKAPSLQRKTIYRLIMQSENPKEMVPYIKSIFQEAKVKEADRSGNAMPGGIYFDGFTQAKNYSRIYTSLNRIAPTNAYLNKNKKQIRANDKARVIIWVQQI